MDRKLHREGEEKIRKSEEEKNANNNAYSKEALNKIDPDTDINSELISREEDIEDRNDTMGGVGAWGGS